MGLIINAPNIHLGGGITLLSSILEELGEDSQTRFFFDERMLLSKGLTRRLVMTQVRPTIWGRFNGEWFLRKLTCTEDIVLCFGNLPPLFRLRGKVLLFLHNRYLVEPRRLKGLSFFQRLRITLERIWFRWRKKNVTHFIVQTPSMRRAVERRLSRPATVLPFSNDPGNYKRVIDWPHDRSGVKGGFLYVASGEPHKNHRNLIEAWILLAGEGIRPGLCLTVDKERFPDLCEWIEEKVKDTGLDITNMGLISTQALKGIYSEALALIYPSDFESFGLPLIEARCSGLPILASEKDYVRDAVDPEETFDPTSPVSIARAVKRFLGIPEKPLPVMDAREWLLKIYEIARQ